MIIKEESSSSVLSNESRNVSETLAAANRGRRGGGGGGSRDIMVGHNAPRRSITVSLLSSGYVLRDSIFNCAQQTQLTSFERVERASDRANEGRRFKEQHKEKS